jgi:hypothetical protein
MVTLTLSVVPFMGIGQSSEPDCLQDKKYANGKCNHTNL